MPCANGDTAMIHNMRKTTTVIVACVLVLLGFSSFVPNHRGSIAAAGVLRVVIDAGHGGHDPGNLGTGRYKQSEKDVSLKVALQLGEYIERAYPDVDVVYTRKDDVFVTLNDRTKIANKAQANLFISIHCNANEREEPAGTETYVMSTTKIPANLELAKRENSVILLEENYQQVYGGFDPEHPDESLIQAQIAQSVYMDNSLNLSAKIQEQYRSRVGRKDRGVKQAGFYVISFTTMPSLLTEIGFLTNRSEEDFLMSENGQTYIASAIYRAFKEYKTEVDGTSPAVADPSEPEPTKTPALTQATEKVEETSTAAAKDESVQFKIQVKVSKEQLALKPENFNGLEAVEEYSADGLFKYTVGNVTDYRKAVSLQRTVREKAYPDAFIIAFHLGERIAISRALELLSSQGNSPAN